MLIPVVRRSVTVNVRDVFHFPFQCACGLFTTAHVVGQASGRASAAYVAPNQQRAQERAYEAARFAAYQLLASTPCPDCGEHSPAQRAAAAAWQRTGPRREKLATQVLLVGGVMVLLCSAGACFIGAKGEADPIKEAFATGLAALIVGGLVIVGLFSLVSPPKEPKLLTEIPEGVWFDPPGAPSASPPSWGAAFVADRGTGPQVAGVECDECSENIVFERDGMVCAPCGRAIHRRCQAEHEKAHPSPRAAGESA